MQINIISLSTHTRCSNESIYTILMRAFHYLVIHLPHTLTHNKKQFPFSALRNSKH